MRQHLAIGAVQLLAPHAALIGAALPGECSGAVRAQGLHREHAQRDKRLQRSGRQRCGVAKLIGLRAGSRTEYQRGAYAPAALDETRVENGQAGRDHQGIGAQIGVDGNEVHIDPEFSKRAVVGELDPVGVIGLALTLDVAHPETVGAGHDGHGRGRQGLAQQVQA